MVSSLGHVVRRAARDDVAKIEKRSGAAEKCEAANKKVGADRHCSRLAGRGAVLLSSFVAQVLSGCCGVEEVATCKRPGRSESGGKRKMWDWTW